MVVGSADLPGTPRGPDPGNPLCGASHCGSFRVHVLLRHRPVLSEHVLQNALRGVHLLPLLVCGDDSVCVALSPRNQGHPPGGSESEVQVALVLEKSGPVGDQRGYTPFGGPDLGG